MTDVVLSHAHDKVLTASGDGTAIAYSLDGGEVMQVLEGHSGAVLSVALTRKGRFAVTGGEDCTARVFDFTTPATPTPKWHEGRIHCLAAREGVAVATTGVWLGGGRCVARWQGQAARLSCWLRSSCRRRLRRAAVGDGERGVPRPADRASHADPLGLVLQGRLPPGHSLGRPHDKSVGGHQLRCHHPRLVPGRPDQRSGTKLYPGGYLCCCSCSPLQAMLLANAFSLLPPLRSAPGQPDEELCLLRRRLHRGRLPL